MATEVRHHHNRADIQMDECPLCGHPFGEDEHRSRHFYDHHTPEDIGI